MKLRLQLIEVDNVGERVMGANNSGRGCCFWGCLSLSVLFLLGGGCTAFVSYRAISFFTTTDPTTLPEIQSTEAEWAELQQKLQAFSTAYDANEPAEISLTAREINLAISQAPETAGRLYVEIENDLLEITGAYPVINLPLVGERFVDGRVVLDLSIENRQTQLELREIEVNGAPLAAPVEEAFLDAFNDEDFLNSLVEDNKDWKEILREVDSLNIVDGRIVLRINS